MVDKYLVKPLLLIVVHLRISLKFIYFVEINNTLMMTEKTSKNTSTPVNEKKKRGSVVLIVVVLLLLIANGFQMYLKHNDNQSIEMQDTTISKQDAEINAHISSIDSLNTDIQSKIDSLSFLGESVDELEAMQIELRDLSRSLKKKNINLAYSKRKLEDRLRGYEELLKIKDAKIESLSLTVTAQGDLIQEKNQTIIRKDYDLEELEKTQSVQNDIIEIAKVLKADKFKISSIKKGKAKEKAIYKSKDLAIMQVSFDLMPNEVADVETKELYIQVKDPSGSTIYDLSTGGGEFDFEGGNQYYTKKIEVLYERNGKHVVFSFETAQPYKSGMNIIEVYTEEKKIGVTGFQVK